MPSHRLDRVRNLIRQVTSQLLPELKDPRVQLRVVTITDVEVSPDLRHARVFVSIYGSTEERAEALQGLISARGFLRRALHDQITLRHIPELSFHLDESLDRGMRVSALLEQARAQAPVVAPVEPEAGSAPPLPSTVDAS